jgi:hypothetical protein
MGFFGYLFEKINGDNFVVLLSLLGINIEIKKEYFFDIFNILKIE